VERQWLTRRIELGWRFVIEQRVALGTERHRVVPGGVG
jgi:hypothetical protein